MLQVTVVVASCGATKAGSLDFRAPGNLLMLGWAAICAGVSHTHEAKGHLEREGIIATIATVLSVSLPLGSSDRGPTTS